MVTRYFSFLLGIAILVLTSCGYQEGVRELNRQSYIRFTGETEGAMAIIDGNDSIEVERTYGVDPETGQKIENNKRTLYLLAPGKHEIVVKKAGTIVVHRNVLINSGSTKEIYVP